MANFALILPRPEMVAQAGRIARQLGMKVVLNQYAVRNRFWMWRRMLESWGRILW